MKPKGCRIIIRQFFCVIKDFICFTERASYTTTLKTQKAKQAVKDSKNTNSEKQKRTNITNDTRNL